MATIVVSGGSKNVGKTSLVRGLLRALPDFGWVAVKVTGHDHGRAKVLFEERVAGEETDTARFLAAGARRAFLMTAEGTGLGIGLKALGTVVGTDANLIFESNRVLKWVEPTVHLAVGEAVAQERKISFARIEHQVDACVRVGGRDEAVEGTPPVFQLAALECVSAEMQRWLRERLQRV